MVVGQDLGITLDMEHWQVKAAAKGIDQQVELVPMGWDAEAGRLVVQHHPTGAERRLDADWVVLAVPPAPLDGLYHELVGHDGVEVHRIGDCVAPRRAHAAVIEGDRIGALL
jgi:2,4-dienoyl-CoA reductase (NADPH2)